MERCFGCNKLYSGDNHHCDSRSDSASDGKRRSDYDTTLEHKPTFSQKLRDAHEMYNELSDIE